MKKILITGGNGFLAKSFYQKLNGENHIICCSRQELDLIDSQAVQAYLKQQQFDVVLHAATYDAAPKYSLKDKTKVLENNLKMFFNLARCGEYFGKMIYFGSGAEFDRAHWQPKMKEDYFDKYMPSDQYGLSKYLMTKHALATDNIINLRLFGVFGEYDDWRYRFIPNACCHALLDLPITINQNALVDFLYIDDLVRIVQWFINNRPSQQVYNVSSGRVVDSIGWAEAIRTVANKDCDIELKTEGLRHEYSGDNSLLIKEMNGFEFSSMQQSLSLLYSWYVDNKSQIDAREFHY